MERRRSALFLDFDNIFSGLLELDREAALALATEPSALIDRLATHGLAPPAHRDLLVRRAYLNPAGSVYDEELGNESRRLYLQRFRPNLTRAGFEVVDCPSLTSAQKNAADIRIVIDVLTLLDQSTHFDEILIASSDADFTPLLLRVRAQDRRTVILTAGPAAPAYKAMADIYLDEAALIGLLRAESTPTVADEIAGEAGADASPLGSVAVQEARDVAGRLVVQALGDADGPVELAHVGELIHSEIGSELIRSTNWFGRGSLSSFVAAVGDGGFRTAAHVVWDPSRHASPSRPAGLPSVVEQVCAITDMPRLERETWPVLFDVLADYAATHRFNLTEASAWSRDELARREKPVGRQSVAFVIVGTMHGGVRLDEHTRPSATSIAEGFTRAMVERARVAGVELDDGERAEVAFWLGVPVHTTPDQSGAEPG
jgi:uncharacterized LabA/DUF88 family protein